VKADYARLSTRGKESFLEGYSANFFKTSMKNMVQTRWRGYRPILHW
jgi:hypothetical protein